MSLADAGLSLLLDPDRLTALVGRPAQATHLRPKPGVTTTAALVGDDGAPWGWIRTLTRQARAKAAKARTVADEVGLTDRLGEAELTGRDTLVQWGPIANDPRLARELARVARVLGDDRSTTEGTHPRAGLPDGATVLRYNPLRRLVLRHDDLVLRVTEDRHRHRLTTTTRALAGAGVPVVVPWRSAEAPDHGLVGDGGAAARPGDQDPVGGRPRRRSHAASSPRTSVWPWVPGRDASGSADPDILRAVGDALGRLHLVDPSTTPDLPRRGWSQLRAAAGDSVALLEQVAPGAASAAGRALALLPQKDPGPHLPLVVVHGDFSLDQCLVAAGTLSHGGAPCPDETPTNATSTTATSTPETPTVDRTGLWLTDLDRAAVSVPVLDHAVLLATALAADDPVLSSPHALAAFADAYAGRTGRLVLVPGVWAAAALLARVAEPWRAQQPGWQVETARRSLLAARLAAEEDAWGERARPTGLAPTAPSLPVLDEGRRCSPVQYNEQEANPDAAARRCAPTEDNTHGANPDTAAITVDRAWPGRVRHGVREITVEGRDHLGRVRAGTVGRDGIPRVLPHGEDPRLPALARVASGGEVVVHRAGRRAVVRTGEGYVKVLRPGRAPAVASAGRVGATLARTASLAAPEVRAADDDTVTFEVLPGRPVHDLSEDQDWTGVWRAWARAWTRLQWLGSQDGQTVAGAPPGQGPSEVERLLAGLPRHTAADEAGVVTTWADRAEEAGLVVARWVERSRWVADRLRAAGDPVRLVPTHRDLHDKQLLWDAGARGGPGLGVLDLDTACLADPVLDPVNLAVHADLRRAQGLWSAEAAEVVVAASREVAGPVAKRWRTAELATVARLVCVYAFRPQWRETVERWAEERWVGSGLDETFLMEVSPVSPHDRASWVS